MSDLRPERGRVFMNFSALSPSQRRSLRNVLRGTEYPVYTGGRLEYVFYDVNHSCPQSVL